MANIPNNPTFKNIKDFINGVVNSFTTLEVNEENETLILNKDITISTQVEDN